MMSTKSFCEKLDFGKILEKLPDLFGSAIQGHKVVVDNGFGNHSYCNGLTEQGYLRIFQAMSFNGVTECMTKIKDFPII